MQYWSREDGWNETTCGFLQGYMIPAPVMRYVSVGHRVPASVHRVSVDTRLGYQTGIDDILGSSDAMDNSAEAIAAGTQWNADDAASYEPVGAAYDILAYTVDLVRAGK